MALNFSAIKSSIFLFSASLTIASPNGCSDPFSAEAAICSNLLSSKSLIDIISVTFGLPSVIVPVLSKIIEFILYAFSKLSPPLINIPFSAPLPVPTIIAVGVASPNAQGQAITRTEINILSENSNDSPPIISHPKADNSAIIKTIGTK
ncbi:hypothetical protein D3C72_1141070 [compost metagenome]